MEPLSEKVAAEDALRMELAAFVENHIETLINALVHIAIVDPHTPPPIRARAKKALSVLQSRNWTANHNDMEKRRER